MGKNRPNKTIVTMIGPLLSALYSCETILQMAHSLLSNHSL